MQNFQQQFLALMEGKLPKEFNGNNVTSFLEAMEAYFPTHSTTLDDKGKIGLVAGNSNDMVRMVIRQIEKSDENYIVKPHATVGAPTWDEFKADLQRMFANCDTPMLPKAQGDAGGRLADRAEDNKFVLVDAAGNEVKLPNAMKYEGGFFGLLVKEFPQYRIVKEGGSGTVRVIKAGVPPAGRWPGVPEKHHEYLDLVEKHAGRERAEQDAKAYPLQYEMELQEKEEIRAKIKQSKDTDKDALVESHLGKTDYEAAEVKEALQAAGMSAAKCEVAKIGLRERFQDFTGNTSVKVLKAVYDEMPEQEKQGAVRVLQNILEELQGGSSSKEGKSLNFNIDDLLGRNNVQAVPKGPAGGGFRIEDLLRGADEMEIDEPVVEAPRMEREAPMRPGVEMMRSKEDVIIGVTHKEAEEFA
ncbi:hypothetical protein HDU96_001069, partial [Phlyctochytrium bullatum]